MDDLTTLLMSLAGVIALITFLVNLGKMIGLVKDGTGETWSKALHLIALVGLFVLGEFFPDVDIWKIDEFAAQLASIGIAILALIPASFWGSEKIYALVRGLPLIGHSNTLAIKKAEKIVAGQ